LKDLKGEIDLFSLSFQIIFGMSEWKSITKKERPKIHHMGRDKALEYEKKMNIDGLAKTLLSERCVSLQEDGYRFYRVIKGDLSAELSSSKEPGGFDYIICPIGNYWGDSAVFAKEIM
jgi:hypothetical protein